VVKVAFVTPELQLLVRRTNLASVSQDLASSLSQVGAEVRVFLPRSKSVDLTSLRDVERAASVEVPDIHGKTRINVIGGLLGNLRVYLFEHDALFGNRHPYGDENGPYMDNWRRYALFARAVLEVQQLLGFEPDVFHCMDWTTGLLPLIHKLEYLENDACDNEVLKRAGTFFSINNLAMQGAFEREILPRIGIPHEYFRHVNGVELAGKVNFLKAGAEFATVVGTHSPNHANRIQERDRGYGLEETFASRKKELVGIHNGIDYRSWNPATDPLLSHNFSAKEEDPAGKRRCKAALQEGLQIDVGPRTLVCSHIGRWDADSGFDLLAEVLSSVLERNVEAVIMGAGGEEVTKRLRTLEGTFMGRIRVIEGYDAAAAHRVMAGSDVLFMPSHYQPSNSLFAVALRYGVVPLVYSSGGLEDTLPDISKGDDGLAVHFSPYSGDGLLDGVLRAADAFKDANAWKKLVQRCMAQDFSWERAAGDYVKAYRRVTRRIRGR
jgi:starch synthase